MSDAVRKNAIPTLASLALHLGLLGGLYYWETHQDPPPKIVEVQVIEAKLVSLKTKTKVAHTEDTRKINKVEVSQAVEKVEDIKNREQEDRKAAAEKLAEETQKKAQQQEEQKKEQETKIEEELAFKRKKEQEKEKEAKEKAEAEAKAAEEKLKAEELAAKAQEEKRKAEDKIRKEKQAEKKKQEQLKLKQAEERRVRAEQSDEAANSYLAMIKDRIERKWNRPPSARNGMACVLRISIVPTGRISDVEVVKSSGSDEFDRSAEQAVRAVEQFKELQGMDPELFEQDFRELEILFRPEDLRQ
ncbi:MAG: protein TolA [Pseudomonadota bacterium]|jgi:colicin import membrane protein